MFTNQTVIAEFATSQERRRGAVSYRGIKSPGAGCVAVSAIETGHTNIKLPYAQKKIWILTKAMVKDTKANYTGRGEKMPAEATLAFYAASLHA